MGPLIIAGVDPGVEMYAAHVSIDSETMRVVDMSIAAPRRNQSRSTWLARWVLAWKVRPTIAVVEQHVGKRTIKSVEATASLCGAIVCTGSNIAIHHPRKMHAEMRAWFSKSGHSGNKETSQRIARQLMHPDDFNTLRALAHRHRAEYHSVRNGRVVRFRSEARYHDLCDAWLMAYYYIQKHAAGHNEIVLD